jgi:hypothetical protein
MAGAFTPAYTTYVHVILLIYFAVWTPTKSQAPVSVFAVLTYAVSRTASPLTESKAIAPETPV